MSFSKPNRSAATITTTRVVLPFQASAQPVWMGVDAKHDPDFGQAPWNLKNKIDTPPFYAGTESPMAHHTMGGLGVEGISARAVDRWGKIIPGLFAAGEVTRGTHGANRLGCNATADCIVFGRIAGKNGAAETR